jgi:hypothetical protein
MAGEQNAWVKLRTKVLGEWGYTRWFRIESPLTAPGFPDIIAFRASGTHFIELKAWESGYAPVAAEADVPPIAPQRTLPRVEKLVAQHVGFREEDIPWRPGQKVVLHQIARAGGKSFCLCLVDRVHWWWGAMQKDGSLRWMER